MSHEITMRTNGKAEMAYAGDKPWHGLGERLEAGASIEDWRKAAGMDWSITEHHVLYQANEYLIRFDGRKILARSDNQMALGVVSDRYKPVQPADVLDYFTDLVEEQGFQMHTAGTLFGGKKFWALAKMEEERFVRNNQDGIGGYVLLCTSCDGSLATTAKFTSIAVVCNNTLSWAINKDRKNDVRTIHTGTFDAKKVKEQLGLAKTQYDTMMGAAEELSKKEVNFEQAEDFLKFLFTDSRLSTGKSAIEESKPYQTILSLFEGHGMGAELDTRRGTAWGLLNAVTEYVDHHSGGKTADRRINHAWFGAGNTIKNDAATFLINM